MPELITLQDILNALVEDLPGHTERYRPEAVQRAGGTWLVDGSIPIEEFRELFSLKELPGEAEDLYHTLGGFIMAALGRIPQAGAQLELPSFLLEVVDMDQGRIDKVLVTPKGALANPHQPAHQGSPVQRVCHPRSGGHHQALDAVFAHACQNVFNRMRYAEGCLPFGGSQQAHNRLRSRQHPLYSGLIERVTLLD